MKRLLIVDDELDIVEVLRELLGHEGYQVLTARNGRMALQVLAEHPVDGVLTDLMMPVMGGRELLRELRADPRHRHLPVVVMSAGAGGQVAREFGVEFLAKPFDFRQLLSAIERAPGEAGEVPQGPPPHAGHDAGALLGVPGPG